MARSPAVAGGAARPSDRRAQKHGGELFGAAIGLVQEGYLADLLLVDGDPSKDVAILQDAERLLGIMKDGALHKHPAACGRAGLAAAE
jgi:N-acyl-D-aspartate/D-glutamate deacylase